MLCRIVVTEIRHISEGSKFELLKMLRNLLSILGQKHLGKDLLKSFGHIPRNSSSLCSDSPRRTNYHTCFHFISVSKLTLKKTCMSLSVLTIQLKSVSLCYNTLPIVEIHTTFLLIFLEDMVRILLFTDVNWSLCFEFLNNPWAELLTLFIQFNASGLLDLNSCWSLTSYSLEPINGALLQVTKASSSIHR